MREIIESYRDVIIQIATPQATGTGFFLKQHGLIVTNEHVVKGNAEVVISGRAFEKRMSKVVYDDAMYDLAFIEASDLQLPEVRVAEKSDVHEGDSILAIGHPYGLKYSATSGIVSKAQRVYNNINYIQVDAAINPGNSGGPLVNQKGEVVGVNTFIFKDGNNLGFALPSDYVAQTIAEFLPHRGKKIVRCTSCSNMVTSETIEDGYCPNCGTKLEGFDKKTEQDYTPQGYPAKVEEIITKLGYDIKLSRRGTNNWEIEKGSANIKINYSEQIGFITGDAALCRLPKQNIGPLYEFMLRENYLMDYLVFSVKGTEVMLSFLIYDHYLTVEAGMKIFQDLFEKADYYDNILHEQFAAIPIAEED